MTDFILSWLSKLQLTIPEEIFFITFTYQCSLSLFEY